MIGEDQVRQPRAVDCSISVEDFAAKMTNNFIVRRLARRVELVRQTVSLQEMRAALD